MNWRKTWFQCSGIRSGRKKNTPLIKQEEHDEYSMVRSLEGKHPQYYEAILQLRDLTSNVVEFVDQEIARAAIPVAKFKKVTNGYDYYLADNSFTKALGRKLQQQFGGELVLSSSLFGQKDGKEIYRGTVLFRQASFGKGDMVEYRGEEYQVIVLGKEIIVQQRTSGKRIHLKYREMGKIKKV